MLEDKVLVWRAQRGSKEAMRRIYEKYKNDLLTSATAMLTDRAAAEDAVHDVFVSFAGGLGRFSLTGSLKGYLATCTANKARDMLRSSAYKTGVLEEQFSLPAGERSPDQGIAVHAHLPDGTLLLKIYFLKKDQYITIVFTEAKKYLQIPLDENTLNRLNELTPKGLISWFQEGPYQKLDRREIEGVTAEGFELKNPPMLKDLMEIYPSVFSIQESIARVWVDVETSLPVAAEGEVITGKGILTGYQELKMEIYSYGVQWDAEINPEIFKLEIPDDYTPCVPFPKEKGEDKIREIWGIGSNGQE